MDAPDHAVSTETVPEERRILRDLWPFHAFAVFNAFFWTLLMGNPMILFVRDLGATRMWVGALASMHVLLGALQLPAAPFASRYGYKRLVLHSWILRTIVMSVVPFLAILPPSVSFRTRLVVFTVVYSLYNVIRGVGVTAFLPWQAAVVPESLRGRFFSRNQFGVNAAWIFVLFLGSFMLGHDPPISRFAQVFGFAVLSGCVSIYFIARCPAPGTPGEERPLGLRKDLGTALRDRDFMRIVWFRVAYAAAVSASGPFLVLFMREEIGLSDATILRYAAGVGVVQLLSILSWGTLADRFGSRSLLKVAVASHVAFLVGWAVCPTSSQGILPWLLLLGALWGFGNSGVTIATLRYAVNRAPETAKAVALALMMSLFGVVMFIMPVVWGRILDLMESRLPEPAMEYRIFFCISAVFLMTAFPLIRRLSEPDLARTGQVLYFLVIGRPLRTAVDILQAVRYGIRVSARTVRRSGEWVRRGNGAFPNASRRAFGRTSRDEGGPEDR